MPRVVHFEIAADDADRVLAFYQSVFGWTFQKWDGPEPYWLVSTGEGRGIDGAVYIRGAGHGSCNTIDVPDIDAYLGKIAAAGGEITIPKVELPGLGFLAYCSDTEGNEFGVWQRA